MTKIEQHHVDAAVISIWGRTSLHSPAARKLATDALEAVEAADVARYEVTDVMRNAGAKAFYDYPSSMPYSMEHVYRAMRALDPALKGGAPVAEPAPAVKQYTRVVTDERVRGERRAADYNAVFYKAGAFPWKLRGDDGRARRGRRSADQ